MVIEHVVGGVADQRVVPVATGEGDGAGAGGDRVVPVATARL